MPMNNPLKDLAFAGSAESSPGPLDVVRAQLVSPDVSLDDDWTMRVERLDARADEQQQRPIALSGYWLPPNDVYRTPTNLSAKPELAGAIVLAVDCYLQRATDSKTRHERAAAVVATLTKAFEYLWLTHSFQIAAVTKAQWMKLANALATGGWHNALDIPKRLCAMLEDRGPATAGELLSQGTHNPKSVRGEAFQAILGTNIDSRELHVYRPALLATKHSQANSDIVKDLTTPSVSLGFGYSMLRQSFEAINLLFDLPAGFAVGALPYPGHVRLAKKLGRPPSRTRNLGALEAGDLLGHSFRWIYEYGPHIRDLIAEICDSVVRAHAEGLEARGHYIPQTLAISSARAWLDTRLPSPIVALDVRPKKGAAAGQSVRQVLLCLLSACFCLIATLNARRRDEVSHRKFGAHTGFVQAIDQSLGVYEGTFYVEKTLQDYMEFFVTKATYDAAMLLEALQASYDRVDRAFGRPTLDGLPIRERALFSYRRFSKAEGVGNKRLWFEFGTRDDGNAHEFLRTALGRRPTKVPNPHMFRRLYALLLMYLHEIQSLQAVAYQLQHGSLNSTRTYCSDPIMRPEAERISAAFKQREGARRAAFTEHDRGIERELAIARDEKLLETVLAIVSGEPASGGYSPFIQRVHRRLARVVDFSSLDEAARAVAKAIKARGQSPDPMRHGQCMAGAQLRVSLAKCRSDADGQTHKERASATTCAKCIFHYVNTAFLRNLEADLVAIRLVAADPDEAQLVRERANWDAENLKETIQLHKNRMGISA